MQIDNGASWYKNVCTSSAYALIKIYTDFGLVFHSAATFCKQTVLFIQKLTRTLNIGNRLHHMHLNILSRCLWTFSLKPCLAPSFKYSTLQMYVICSQPDGNKRVSGNLIGRHIPECLCPACWSIGWNRCSCGAVGPLRDSPGSPSCQGSGLSTALLGTAGSCGHKRNNRPVRRLRQE